MNYPLAVQSTTKCPNGKVYLSTLSGTSKNSPHQTIRACCKLELFKEISFSLVRLAPSLGVALPRKFGLDSLKRLSHYSFDDFARLASAMVPDEVSAGDPETGEPFDYVDNLSREDIRTCANCFFHLANPSFEGGPRETKSPSLPKERKQVVGMALGVDGKVLLVGNEACAWLYFVRNDQEIRDMIAYYVDELGLSIQDFPDC